MKQLPFYRGCLVEEIDTLLKECKKVFYNDTAQVWVDELFTTFLYLLSSDNSLKKVLDYLIKTENSFILSVLYSCEDTDKQKTLIDAYARLKAVLLEKEKKGEVF